MRIRELEDEVKKLKKSLQSVNNAPQKLLDLQVTHNSAKDELERVKMKNAAHRREIAELKSIQSGAVANLKLQYQTDNMDSMIKMKNMEIDLAAEKRMRVGLEAELKVERSATVKLRAKLDDLLVAEVKSGKVLETMGEKARMKRVEQDAKYNHSHAVVDRAIAKKGRGRGRGSRSNKKKKGKESRDKERESRNAFEEWTRRGVDDRGDYSDDNDSLGDYTSDESSVSSSDGGSSSCNNRRKRRRNQRSSRKKRRSRSRGEKRMGNTSRSRRKSSYSYKHSGRRATVDIALSSDDNSVGRSIATNEKKGGRATNESYDVVEAGSVTGYSGTTVSINVSKSDDKDLSVRLSQSSIGADDA